jgi:hypothetical protein
MNLGPLGFPRLTSIPPLVSEPSPLFSAERIPTDQLKDLVEQAINEEDVPIQPDLEQDEINQLSEAIADKVYPPESPVSTAKNVRLKKCVGNKWANQWAIGMARETGMAQTDNDFDLLLMRFNGCIGLTETNTSDDPRLVPEQYKPDSAIEPDAPQLIDQ